MNEKKTATPEDAKRLWDSMDYPTSRTVRERLIEEGYEAPSFKTISIWAKKGKWPKPKHKGNAAAAKAAQASAESRKRRKVEPIDNVAKALTGDDNATAKDLIPLLTGKKVDGSEAEEPKTEAGAQARDAFDDLLQRLKKIDSDEDWMRACSNEAYRTATVLFGTLGTFAKELVIASPEGAGRAFQAISAGLETASDPIKAIAASREASTKILTINGAEIIPPEEYDPVAEALRAVVNGR